MSVTPIPIGEFRNKLLFVSESRSANIVHSMLRLLRTAEGLGVATTADLTSEFVDRFTAKMDQDGFADSTKHNYMNRLRLCCITAVKTGHLETSPFDNRTELVIGPHIQLQNRARTKVRSPVQFRAAMDHLAANAAKGLTSHRIYALAAVIAYTGATHYDAVLLKPSDVNLPDELIRFTRRQQKGRLPAVAPMPPELVRILAEWLKTPFDPGSSNRRLSPEQVAEVRSLWSGGLNAVRLGERFGVSSTSIRQIVKRKLYKYVPKTGESFKTIAELDWLFPTFRKNEIIPWTVMTSWRELDGAGKAVGLDRLTLTDFRYLYRHTVVPSLLSLKPHQAEPLAEVSPVLLGSLATPPSVLGIEIPDPPLTEQEYDCLIVLKKYEPNHVELPRLKKESDVARPDRILQGLEAKHELWGKVLDVWPSKRVGGATGYGFKRG